MKQKLDKKNIPFNGLGEKLPEYLDMLRQNNNRPWYHENKEAFKENVLLPVAALVEAITPAMLQIDSSMVAKCSRPQRDTRFSANKSPYHTSLWFTFRRIGEQWTEAPAYFFDVNPEGCTWGMGFYQAKAATMTLLREMVLQNQTLFSQTLALAEKQGFSLGGEAYKRMPKMPDGIPKEITQIYQVRNIYLHKNMVHSKELLDSNLKNILKKDFELISPIYDLFQMAYNLANQPDLQ